MSEFNIYISSLFSIFLLVILIFWLYRDYRVDTYRQKMFKLRDCLFDEARKGNVPFESDAYRMLRSTMNGSIRFAHKLSLIQFLVFLVLMKSDSKHIGKSFSKRLESKIELLDNEQAKLIRYYHANMNFLLVEHILFSSPLILTTVLIPVASLFKAKKVISKTLNTFQSPIDKLDSAAFAIGRA